MEALFLLAFALALPQARTVRSAIPLGVIGAGAVYAYSFPGLFWLIGAAGDLRRRHSWGIRPRRVAALDAALRRRRDRGRRSPCPSSGG